MRSVEEGLLLLRCRLGQAVRPLTETEYRQLVAVLQRAKAAGMQGKITEELLRSYGVESSLCERALTLLHRREVLQRYLDSAPEISVLTRLGAGFPQRLRALGGDCPPALFCKGELSLLNTRCVALVGSRRLYERGSAFAAHIGALAAKEGLTLVSGGAVGADRIAQEACLRAGGSVICFIPDAPTRYPVRKNLLLCSDEGYELDFSSTRALRRNLYIHALGEKTFVAQCPLCRGGTWSGTRENLRRGLSEVYALHDGSEGIAALAMLGAVLLDEFPVELSGLTPSELSIFN